MSREGTTQTRDRLVRRHLLEGWGGLFLFVCLGVVLELLLAYKVRFYVDADQETGRLMWRLAHAHGTLLSLVHLAIAWSLSRFREGAFPQPAGLLSGLMTGAGLLIPAGFFLGGLNAKGGDPSSAIALVPMGAVLLLGAIGLAFAESRRISHNGPQDRDTGPSAR